MVNVSPLLERERERGKNQELERKTKGNRNTGYFTRRKGKTGGGKH